MKPVRWGIIGIGSIVTRILPGLRLVPGASAHAIAARDIGRTREYAQKMGIPRATTVDALLEREDVDAVYVATPHPSHCELTLAALSAGKPVLCEKPVAMSLAELDRMIALAKEKNLFFMEAMWSRLFPAARAAQSWAASGRIGQIRALSTAFSFRAHHDPSSRLLNPDLGGGALLDVGCYTLHNADLFFDAQPTQTASAVCLGDTGVDEQSTLLLRYGDGAIATLRCGMTTFLEQTTVVSGTEGQITMPDFWHPKTATLRLSSGQTETFTDDYAEEGFQYEFQHVSDCLEQGIAESPLLPHETSRRVMRLCDGFRAEWGLRYPWETDPGRPC